MEERTPVIAFRNADILNGENCVIYGLDMEVLPGDFMYIVGKVGTGKTSIIRTMIAENPLLTGEGTVCGYDLRRIKADEIPYLRRRLGVVFQDFQLLMDRNVEDNLAFVLKATGWKEGAGFDRRIPTCSSTPLGAYFTWEAIRSGGQLINHRMKERAYTPMSQSAPPPPM